MNISSLTPSLHTQFSVAHRIIVWRRWYENVVQCCCKVIAPFPDSNIAFPLLLTITVALLLSYHSLTHHSSSTHHSLITHSSPTHLAFSMQFGFTIDTHSDAFTHTLTYFNNILPLHYITLPTIHRKMGLNYVVLDARTFLDVSSGVSTKTIDSVQSTLSPAQLQTTHR